MYDLQSLMYDLQSSMYGLQSSMYGLQSSMYDLQSSMYDLQSLMYDIILPRVPVSPCPRVFLVPVSPFPKAIAPSIKREAIATPYLLAKNFSNLSIPFSIVGKSVA
ncbi:MAG: hypothetical protein F6K35_38540 [Okeania sp. SIO2H7]|nr:hypothetical protein [Okeania sp. SIO2H7]